MSTTEREQSLPVVTGDGLGGAIVVWEEKTGDSFDIRAQRLDRNGNLMWGPEGVDVCSAASDQKSALVICDASGNAVVAWEDNRYGVTDENCDIYAQKLDPSGNRLWAEDARICDSPNASCALAMVADGRGGAILAWSDYRNNHWDIYARRVDSDGVPRWTENGVPVCVSDTMKYQPEIVTDTNGGAIICWVYEDADNWRNVRTQRIDGDGNVLWDGNGSVVCAASRTQYEPAMASDGAGGAIITWNDTREGHSNIYAQRVAPSGEHLWAREGLHIYDHGSEPEVTSDGSGGAIIAWDDSRLGYRIVYAQRVDSAGSLVWDRGGVLVSSDFTAHELTGVVSDGDGGAVVAWHSARESIHDTYVRNLYAQRIDSGGECLWARGGDACCLENSDKQTLVIAPAGAGGAFLAWDDHRSGSPRINAQKVANNPGLTSRQWAHDSIGAIVPAKTWYLAEGSTGTNDYGAFETWVLVQNPNDVEARIELTYMTDSGPVPGPSESLTPKSRRTYNVADVVPDDWSVATRVEGDQPVIAEVAMYQNNRHRALDSTGATEAATTWYFAEGTTGPATSTYILVQNPNDLPADVELTYMTPDGPVPGQRETLAAKSRKSFNVTMMVYDWEVSTMVQSDQPVVAARSTLFGRDTVWSQGTIGATVPADTWYLAEGCTAGGFETWVLVLNPNDAEAEVTLTHMTPGGIAAGPTEKVPAKSRKTFKVAEQMPDEWSVSTMVQGTQPIVVERSMYGGDRSWAHGSVGTPDFSDTWYLAEGCTGEGFETWVLVQNPNGAPAKVELAYMTPAGEVQGPVFEMPPDSRTTVNVAETVSGEYSVSTMVSSDLPVIAERAMYGDPI